MSEDIDNFLATVLGVLLRVGAAFLVVVIGRWLARRSRTWLAKALKRVALTPSMETLFLTATYYAVWILTMMVALIVLGVPVTTVVAIVGIVVVVLGIALQQSLRDLAAAVNFLLFKPFVVGDFITADMERTVREVFGSLPKTAPPAEPLPMASPLKKSAAQRLERDVKDGYLYLGFVAPDYNNADQ